MQQIYSVGGTGTKINGVDTPAPGRSLNWPTLRAASKGFDRDQWRTLWPHAHGVAATSTARLALLKTESGRVLTHAVSEGDGYFAHTLVNVPESADAHLAIQTWGSPLWQRRAPDSTSDLPELPYLPVADVLNDESLQEWLGQADHRDWLEFALHALLSSATARKIVFVAGSESVANIVFGLSRALPANLLEDFTFSTAEGDPNSSSARLIGTEATFGDYFFTTASVFDTTTGKRSDLKGDVPFARFAADALAQGNFSGLDELKSTWQRLGLNETAKFDLLFRLTRGGGTLTKTEAVESLQHPPLAAWISNRPEVRTQLLEWALDDRAFATASFGRAVQGLRQNSDALGKLATQIRTAGTEAIREGNCDRAALAYEVLLPMVAPAKANAIWGELLKSETKPQELAWPMRGFLLPRFIRFKQQTQPTAGIDPAFAPWLEIPTERLGEFLALDLPKNYRLEAGRAALRRAGEPTAELIGTLAQFPELTLTLLKPDDGEDRAAELYAKLIALAQSGNWFEAVLGQSGDYPPTLLNRFFELSLEGETLAADGLVRSRGAKLLELFAGQSGLDKLGREFLKKPPEDSLANPELLKFLGELNRQPNLGDDLKERIGSILALRAYWNKPSFDAESLRTVAEAFAVTPTALPTTAKLDTFRVVAHILESRFGRDEFQTELEAVLTHLGSTLANDNGDLFENLLREFRSPTQEYAKQGRAVEALLALALGATELRESLDGLDGHAFTVASDAAKRGGSKFLDRIDKATQTWPKEARTKWGFLLAAVRPKSRFGRDIACFAIGLATAAVACAAWTIWRG